MSSAHSSSPAAAGRATAIGLLAVVCWSCTVGLMRSVAEPLGADTLLHGRFGDTRELMTVRQAGHVLAKPGEKRRFNVHAAHVHLFDAQTGRRIPGL